MSDERRQQPTVNLQELERQLREAARARQRAHASAETLSAQVPDRTQSQPIPNPQPQPAQSYAQPGLPLTAPSPSAPAYQPPQSSVQTQSAQASFRPINAPQTQPTPTSIPPAPSFSQPPLPPSREPVQTYAPQQSFTAQRTETYRQADENDFDSTLDVLKTDRMGDVYPPIETEAVDQEQYYSAAAYEDSAANSYDRYTEDQFPRIEPERRPSTIARVFILMVIVAFVGTGGYYVWPIAQSLLTSGSQTAKAPPLIKADPAPVKVEPEAQPQDNANVPKDIFTKHANEDPKTAQIAPSAEQPADVNAAVKAGAATQAEGAKPPVVPLVPGTGEPRVVKTVTVRADGSIIPEKSDPSLTAKTVPPGPKVIQMPQPIAPIAGQASALPVQSASEPALPAKPVAQSSEFVLDGPVPLPPERLPEAEQDFSLPLDTITTPLSASPEPAAAEPVAAPAPAVSAPVAATAGKDFAVQFGAPETDAKGNELKARVEKQFASALTGGTVAVVKGESNGRPVFRVRAIGYTREEANAVCQQVSAAGGQCFVSRNN